MGKNKFEKFIKGHKLDWNKDCATLRDILFTAPAKNVIHGFAMKDPRFVKVHRSYIINLDKIKDIEENTLVIAETVIPISRSHKQALLNRLNFL